MTFKSNDDMREVSWNVDESEIIADNLSKIISSQSITVKTHAPTSEPIIHQSEASRSVNGPRAIKSNAGRDVSNHYQQQQSQPLASQDQSGKNQPTSQLQTASCMQGNNSSGPFIESSRDNQARSLGTSSILPPTLRSPSRSMSTTSSWQEGLPVLRIHPSGPLQNVMIVSGVEGKWSLLNELAKKNRSRAIIHTGNFGFYDEESLKTISSSAIKGLLHKRGITSGDLSEVELRTKLLELGSLSELSSFVHGTKHFQVPIYVVWGQHEDVRVIEKFRKGVYHIPNLYLLDHRNSFAISTGHVTLRLFGLGGSFNYHKLFDVGTGTVDIVCGEGGSIWANFIQMGELLEMADHYSSDQQELRIFVSQANPLREPLAHILSTALKADFTISPGENICTISNDALVFRNHTILSSYLTPAREDIKSLWDQVYFACTNEFTDPQRKSGQRLVAALKKDLSSLDLQPKASTHISVSLLRLGEVKFVLSDESIIVETAFTHPVHSTLKNLTTQSTTTITTLLPPVSEPPKHRPTSGSRHVQDARLENKEPEIIPSLGVPSKNIEKESEPCWKIDKTGISATKKVASTGTFQTSKLPEKETLIESANKSLSKMPPITSVVDNITTAAATSTTKNGIVKGNGKDGEPAITVRNLPFDITGEELDDQVFSSYEVFFVLSKALLIFLNRLPKLNSLPHVIPLLSSSLKLKRN